MVQKYVAGFDVSVVNGGINGRMKMCDGLCGFSGNGESNRPRKTLASLLLQMLTQCSVGHELVHKDLFSVFNGATQQANQVGVAHRGQELDLVHYLFNTVSVSVFYSFDGNPFVAVQFPCINRAVRPSSQPLFL